jgi:hypothetical protein
LTRRDAENIIRDHISIHLLRGLRITRATWPVSRLFVLREAYALS